MFGVILPRAAAAGGGGGGGLEAEASEVVLSQRQVAVELIPAVIAGWQALHRSVADMTISTADLRLHFGRLGAVGGLDAVNRELDLLALTGAGPIASLPSGPDSERAVPEWVPAAQDKLDEFLLLERLAGWIPAILHVRGTMASLCELTEDEDATVGAVRAVHDSIGNDWASKTLSTVSELVSPVKHLFKGFSDQQLDYLSKLAANDGLVEWLLAHGDTEKFTSLLQVHRPTSAAAP